MLAAHIASRGEADGTDVCADLLRPIKNDSLSRPRKVLIKSVVEGRRVNHA